MQDKTVAGLLALFLGCLGIHWFYMGDQSKGVTYLLVSILSIGFLAPIIAILSLIDGIKFFLMSEVEFKKILDKKGTEREDIEEEENTEEEESLESELEKLYREYPLSLENMEMRKKLEAKIREDWKTKKVQQKKEKKERKDEGKEEEKGETQSGGIKMSDLRELAQMRKDGLIDEEEYGELKKNIIS